MILTHCAACAVPLPRPAKQCSRCKTLYCGPACQKQHWDAGGHDKLCKKIKKGGGAEPYHANKKFKEAVSEAGEECAEDTKGQTCFICTEAVHRHTKEGLVRGCSCRGTAGFAHVSCLAEQAKIWVEEAEDDNLGDQAEQERFGRWNSCSLCEQNYHGVVACALGWACWKTYVGRPEVDWARGNAMLVLGNGLSAADHHEDALPVKEAQLSIERRLGGPPENLLTLQCNLANSYYALGREDEALRLRRDVYFGWVKLHGEEHEMTLSAANNYAVSLNHAERYKEVKSLYRRTVPVAQRVLGANHDFTLRMRWNYAVALYKTDGATLDDLRESVETLEDTVRIARRVLGAANPRTPAFERELRIARATLEVREAGFDSISDALAAMEAGDASEATSSPSARPSKHY